MRGFKVVKGFEEQEVLLPKRSTAMSAGYDIAVITEFTIEPGEIYLAPTGVKAFMADDEVLKLYPRSSLAIKKKVTIPNNVGIIDADYFENSNNDGHIFVALYNFGKVPVLFQKGERVAQAIFEKFLKVEADDTIDQRTGGFGSTGK